MQNRISKAFLRISFLLIFYGYTDLAYCQTPANKDFIYNIKQTDEEIVLDGKIDEEIWKESVIVKQFTPTFPIDTGKAKARTHIRLCYDEDHLYMSAVCFDSISGKFIVESLKRDFSYPKTDAVAIFLNPLNDETNGFSFAVSPFGSQREGLIANGGTFGVTTSWDNKWFSKVNRYQDRWIAEIAIPFKTLRYEKNDQSWNVNFGRQDLKLNENSTWVPVPRGFNVANLAYRGKIVWDKPPPKPGSNIAIIPYGITRLTIDNEEETSRNLAFNTGLDAKVALGSSMNLDITVNPDFSQVDVDQQVINLDRFSIFFPERRYFFLENSDLFANFGFSRIRPFFSRRIGLSGSGTIPILGGLRLSGNIDQNWRIGVMSLQTEGVSGVEESQNYSVAAFQRKILSRSNIAAIVVNKQAFSGFSAIKGDFNTIAGVDFNINSKDDRIKGKLFYHHSFSSNMPGDAMAHALWLQYSDPDWYAAWNHEYIGGNYDAEVGFVPRKNVFRLEPIISRNFYPNKGIVNRYNFELYQDYYLLKEGDILDRNVRPSFYIGFENLSEFNVSYSDIKTKLLSEFNPVGEGEPLNPGDYYYRNAGISYNSSFRKTFAFSSEVIYGSFYNGNRLTYRAGIQYRARPWGSFILNFERNEISLPDPHSDGELSLIGLESVITFTNSIFWTTFVQYNTQVNNVNINSRLQWRYKPLSDLFIVYTDNYTDDFRNKNRAIVLKLNYWFNL